MPPLAPLPLPLRRGTFAARLFAAMALLVVALVAALLVAFRGSLATGFATYLFESEIAHVRPLAEALRARWRERGDWAWLRGVGVTDANGEVTFTTIFPGCHAGRYPHMHFELFPSLASATSQDASILISQIAMPQEACTNVSPVAA